jgi:hypothetical protein
LCHTFRRTVADVALEKAGEARPETREPNQPAQAERREQRRLWTGPLPQVVCEDCIDIGNGRYAHFRRDRCFAQVQVTFTAPEGVDPNPGSELTDQFKEQGWTWWPNEPGKPWVYQLEQSSKDDPTARGDSRDALHEQFVIMIQEYRLKHGMPPTFGWESLAESREAPNADRQSPFGQLRPTMPDILQDAEEQRHNVIVRPRSSVATLIQLDDLGEDAAARLRPVSFLVLRTSPGSYQAWVAVSDADVGFARRLRQGAGADLTASGATRISGSMNFKEKYAPGYPRVETVHASPGRVATRAELEVLGVVAPLEKSAPAVIPVSRQRASARGWPSYQRCVENAPPARGGGRPDISRADFTFCLLAIDWGWSVEETAARLMQESGKAQENGEAYALRTARNAAAAIERRGGWQR